MDPGSAAYESQGPTLLASQPPTLGAETQKTGRDWSDIYTHLESRMGMMRSWRYSWWTYWAILAEYILPERYHWLIVANKMAKGRPLNNAIVDSKIGRAHV